MSLLFINFIREKFKFKPFFAAPRFFFFLGLFNSSLESDEISSSEMCSVGIFKFYIRMH